MKIAFIMGSSSRTSGGLYNSVRQLGQHLLKIPNTEVQVFAYMDSDGEQDNQAYGELPLSIYHIRGPKSFGYSSDLYQNLEDFKPDIIHTQCIWMYLSYVAYRYSRKYQCPVIVSPRGMLDKWALQHAGIKKKLALHLFEKRNLDSAAVIHALNQPEADAIRAFGQKNPVVIIPNGVETTLPDKKDYFPSWRHQIGKAQNRKILLFLSRIHPKKGLDYLLEAWKELQEKDSEAKEWILTIAGWGDKGYLNKLEAYTRQHGLEGSVFFIGPQLDAAKAATFHRADAFILPSFSEGLPMAVLEAWSYGVPTLITTACNLPIGFENDAAIRIAATRPGIYQGLRQLLSMSPKEREQIGTNGKRLVEEHFLWPQIAEKFRRVYQKVLSKN